MSIEESRLDLPVPAYMLDHDEPAALFSRLQRVVIHLERLQGEAVRDFDISFRDFVILATLRKEPAPHELAVTQIARYVLRPMGSISSDLDRVERAGLVSRGVAAEDRRKVMVRLTADGQRLADDVLDSYNSTRARVFDRLRAEQLGRVDAAVNDLLSALETDYVDDRDPRPDVTHEDKPRYRGTKHGKHES
ncbi:MAG: MarR family winged helix-turn-helix transcriptional regulator [Microthrixaceae bacterium]